jgi:hypothetical protein
MSDVLDAVVAALGTTASRSRMIPYKQAELPAENVLPEDEAYDYEDSDSIEVHGQFNVRYMVVAADGAEQLADQRFVRGTKILQTDPTLSSLTRIIRVRKSKWEMEEGEKQILTKVVTYEAEFGISRNDPSHPGY